MNIVEQDCEIKKELRASMNGILSSRMRKAGMPYRLIFGVELPRLQNIACEFVQDAALANYLWEQNIRETRLLAIMLMPLEAFTSETANHWAETLLTAEEAQVLSMHLLSKSNIAKTVCLDWLRSGETLPSVCALLSLRHLLFQGIEISDEEMKEIDACITMMQPSANLHLRKAIQAFSESTDSKHKTTCNSIII